LRQTAINLIDSPIFAAIFEFRFQHLTKNEQGYYNNRHQSENVNTIRHIKRVEPVFENLQRIKCNDCQQGKPRYKKHLTDRDVYARNGIRPSSAFVQYGFMQLSLEFIFQEIDMALPVFVPKLGSFIYQAPKERRVHTYDTYNESQNING